MPSVIEFQLKLEMFLGEFQLCSTINLPPTTYITCKTVLLSGAQLNNGTVEEKQIKKYLSKAGWIQHKQAVVTGNEQFNNVSEFRELKNY